jgi:hypothetical protein
MTKQERELVDQLVECIELLLDRLNRIDGALLFWKTNIDEQTAQVLQGYITRAMEEKEPFPPSAGHASFVQQFRERIDLVLQNLSSAEASGAEIQKRLPHRLE